MSEAVLPLPNTPSWRDAQLKKAQGNFIFTLHLTEGELQTS
jgi:hypothetical protein